MGRRRLIQLGAVIECLGLALGGAVTSQPAPWLAGAGITDPAASATTSIPSPATTPDLSSPELRRQFNPLDQIASLSSSLATVSSSAQRLASSLSQVQADASAAQSSLAASAATATSSASLAVASAQASASSAISSAIAMASSASSSASAAMAAAAAAMADATSVKAQANSQVQIAQGSAVSVTQAAIAVVGAIIGSALLTLAGFFIFVRYRRAKVREQEEDAVAQEQAAAALNRAVMSYMGKENMPRSSYRSYAGYASSVYAPSEYGTRSMAGSRPSTADKSAIPGMGVFSLALRDPAKQPSTGQPLERVEEDRPEDEGDDTWDGQRASNWPFRKSDQMEEEIKK